MLTIISSSQTILGIFQALHDAGYVHNDIQPWNIVRSGGENDTSMRLIDLESVKKHKCPARKAAVNTSLRRVVQRRGCQVMFKVARILNLVNVDV